MSRREQDAGHLALAGADLKKKNEMQDGGRGASIRKRQRAIDRRVLFPTLIRRNFEQGHPPERAVAAMRVHVSIDSAWEHPEEWEAEGGILPNGMAEALCAELPLQRPWD